VLCRHEAALIEWLLVRRHAVLSAGCASHIPLQNKNIARVGALTMTFSHLSSGISGFGHQDTATVLNKPPEARQALDRTLIFVARHLHRSVVVNCDARSSCDSVEPPTACVNVYQSR
jgi:hypothetical protein